MTERKGRFIVFEGLDGAGTTTQTGRLHDYFTRSGADSFRTFEPTASATGAFIREVLAGKAGPRLPEAAMALLFAADRLAHSVEIEETLRSKTHVVCDRYIFSSMAYQSLDPTIPGERVIELNRGCAIPDLTIFLDVPTNVCMARVSARNESPTIYEKENLLDKIAANYDRLRPLYKEHFGTFVSIDGTQSPDEVSRDIVEAVESR